MFTEKEILVSHNDGDHSVIIQKQYSTFIYV